MYLLSKEARYLNSLKKACCISTFDAIGLSSADMIHKIFLTRIYKPYKHLSSCRVFQQLRSRREKKFYSLVTSIQAFPFELWNKKHSI